jgi:hypothetical protein
MVAMLYKTNIFGIVGSENNDDYKQNHVLIWDDLSNQILYKFTLNDKVINLKLRRDKIFIVTKAKIYILNPQQEYIISGVFDTGLNEKGLLAINYNEENIIIVYPSCQEDQEKGELTIRNLDNNTVKYFSPHSHKVAYIALSYNGLFLATASEDGKKIRIFESETLNQLQELNRGKEKAEIKYISIDFKNQYLAASSERGTIHIWSLYQSLAKLKESGKYKINENDNKILKLTKEVNNLKEQNKTLKEEINKYKILLEKEKEMKNKEIKKDINSIEKKNSSNLFEKNSGNTSLSSFSKLKISEETTKTNSIKVNHLPIEKLKIKEKLKEYRKLNNEKMDEITRNKSNHCKTYRDRLSSNISSHSKEHSLEKNNRSNLSSMSNNHDLSKKLIDLTIKAVKKEERKNKTPMRKIPINNKTKSLVEYLKKNKSKIIVNKIISSNSNSKFTVNNSANPSFCSEIYGNSVDDNNNCVRNNNINHSKNYSISQINLRQLIFSKCSQNDKINKKL